MVLYICNKCNKNFTRKQSFQAHINRKYSCILTENININLELEENNKQYEKIIKQLEEKNKLYEDKIKRLEEKNIILECENKTLNNLVSKCL